MPPQDDFMQRRAGSGIGIHGPDDFRPGLIGVRKQPIASPTQEGLAGQIADMNRPFPKPDLMSGGENLVGRTKANRGFDFMRDLMTDDSGALKISKGPRGWGVYGDAAGDFQKHGYRTSAASTSPDVSRSNLQGLGRADATEGLAVPRAVGTRGALLEKPGTPPGALGTSSYSTGDFGGAYYHGGPGDGYGVAAGSTPYSGPMGGSVIPSSPGAGVGLAPPSTFDRFSGSITGRRVDPRIAGSTKGTTGIDPADWVDRGVGASPAGGPKWPNPADWADRGVGSRVPGGSPTAATPAATLSGRLGGYAGAAGDAISSAAGKVGGFAEHNFPSPMEMLKKGIGNINVGFKPNLASIGGIIKGGAQMAALDAIDNPAKYVSALTGAGAPSQVPEPTIGPSYDQHGRQISAGDGWFRTAVHDIGGPLGIETAANVMQKMGETMGHAMAPVFGGTNPDAGKFRSGLGNLAGAMATGHWPGGNAPDGLAPGSPQPMSPSVSPIGMRAPASQVGVASTPQAAAAQNIGQPTTQETPQVANHGPTAQAQVAQQAPIGNQTPQSGVGAMASAVSGAGQSVPSQAAPAQPEDPVKSMLSQLAMDPQNYRDASGMWQHLAPGGGSHVERDPQGNYFDAPNAQVPGRLDYVKALSEYGQGQAHSDYLRGEGAKAREQFSGQGDLNSAMAEWHRSQAAKASAEAANPTGLPAGLDPIAAAEAKLQAPPGTLRKQEWDDEHQYPGMSVYAHQPTRTLEGALGAMSGAGMTPGAGDERSMNMARAYLSHVMGGDIPGAFAGQRGSVWGQNAKEQERQSILQRMYPSLHLKNPEHWWK